MASIAAAGDVMEQLEATRRERAHLRQEVDSGRAHIRMMAAAERRQIRTDRILLELVRGRPWERDLRELLDLARARAAVEP